MAARGIALALGLAIAASAAAQPAITLPEGRIAGTSRDGVRLFLGIPYAAPPVGPLRWRPPQPAARWRDVRDARRFGPACPQNDPLGVFAAPSEAEDCLTLNVFAPALAHRRPLPVLLWIPGGGQVAGSAADYDAAQLARGGRMVVVTFNYRFGLFGFFAHPALGGEGHPLANYGLLDQQAAMRWVRRTIGRFGGDPARVTLGGQSAGGSSVLAALVSPGARGLFARAIDMSGARLLATPLFEAQRRSEAFAAKVGCATATCLRALPVRTILEHGAALQSGVTLDGTVLPEQPAAAFAAGRVARVPLMVGFVRDEQAFNLAARELRLGALRAPDYPGEIALYFGRDNAPRILAAYPVDAYPSPSEAEIAAARDARSCTGRWIAQAVDAAGVPAFAYQFDDVTAPSYFPQVGFPMAAYHTAELQYLFPAFRGGLGTTQPLNPAQTRLARTMRDTFANFVRAGDPNGPGLPPWPRYRPAQDAVRSFGGPTALTRRYGFAHRCDFWRGIIPR